MWRVPDSIMIIYLCCSLFFPSWKDQAPRPGRQKRWQHSPCSRCSSSDAVRQWSELGSLEISSARSSFWLLYAVWSINWHSPMPALLMRCVQGCRCVHKNVIRGPQPNSYGPKLLSNVKLAAFMRTRSCNLLAEGTTIYCCDWVRRK